MRNSEFAMPPSPPADSRGGRGGERGEMRIVWASPALASTFVRSTIEVECGADEPAAVDVVEDVVAAGPLRISCEADDAGGLESCERESGDIVARPPLPPLAKGGSRYADVELGRGGRDRGIARARPLRGRRQTHIDGGGCQRIIGCDADAARSPDIGGGEETAGAGRPLSDRGRQGGSLIRQGELGGGRDA